jgi:hypothetical protein
VDRSYVGFGTWNLKFENDVEEHYGLAFFSSLFSVIVQILLPLLPRPDGTSAMLETKRRKLRLGNQELKI